MTTKSKQDPTPLEKLQELLRSLFQFELSDLDFGIYRLFRIKQDELKAFIDRQLPETVERAFAGVASSDTRTLTAEVARLAERVRTEIDPHALLDNGAIKQEFRNINAARIKELVLDYETKKAKLDAVRVTEEQKLDVYNHLFNFFSRYYDAGDFIPKRFYGGRDRYAVPYNGAETYFHWANKDQHYVKTAEAFRDYAFTVEALGGPFRVRFVITAANVPKDNTKGDRRYFFPLPADATYDQETRTFRLPFHYRLPTATEVKGGNGPSAGEDDDEGQPKRLNGDKLQEAVLQAALPDVLAAVPEPALAGALGEVINREAVESDGAEPMSLLMKRCRHFTRRNTSDYFIHKNLQKFLTEELEFYIKDQILHIGDLEGDFEGKRRMLRAFRQVAADLIAFLSQIEDVQLRLFEKRKFVLRADYLVTVANIPKPLRKEILDPQRGAKQLAEWKRLYAFDECAELLGWKGKLTEAFLQRHPTLVVNTANFDAEFRDVLLESIEDLEAVTDGLVVKSENYQALRLLAPSFWERIKCIYIDPPYNTASDEFVYKDQYQHSSWLAMMAQRMERARDLMHRTGAVLVSLDDNEAYEFRLLMRSLFQEDNFVCNFVRRRRMATGMRSEPISPDHEYVVAYARSKPEVGLTGKFQTPENYPFEDHKGRYASTDLTVGMTKEMRPNQFYALRNPESGKEYWPPDSRVWRFEPATMESHVSAGDIIWPDQRSDRMTRPRFKTRYDPSNPQVRPISTWIDTEASADDQTEVLVGGLNQQGTKELRDLFGTQLLQYPKPVSFIRALLDVALGTDGWVMDFFAGSGTTAQAILELNREDGQARRFLLAEMGSHFDAVVIPRLQKVIGFPAWGDGRPVRVGNGDETTQRGIVLKILRLESYEDALHNLTAGETLARSDVRAAAYAETVGAETYRLQYLARLPLAESASMLQLDKLEHPFDYTLEILTDEGPQTQTVDLVETFNYLLGLDVQRLETWHNAKDAPQGQPRRYRIVKGRDRRGKRVLVAWRDMTELDPKAEREFLEARLKREEPFDRRLINGDSATPGFESLDGLFKQLMTE